MKHILRHTLVAAAYIGLYMHPGLGGSMLSTGTEQAVKRASDARDVTSRCLYLNMHA